MRPPEGPTQRVQMSQCLDRILLDLRPSIRTGNIGDDEHAWVRCRLVEAHDGRHEAEFMWHAGDDRPTSDCVITWTAFLPAARP